MKKKSIACLLVGALAVTAVGAWPMLKVEAEPAMPDGKLMITEPGTYVLQGSMAGSVVVDPGQGNVELVLDGADINGGNNPAIMAMSGDKLTVTIPEGSVNRVMNGGFDPASGAAVYSRIDTVFEGDGSLYVTGENQNGIRVQNGNLTVNGGNYAVKAQENGFEARTMTVNGGNFNVQAENTVDPSARFFMNGGMMEETAPEFGEPQMPGQMPGMNFEGEMPGEMSGMNFEGEMPGEMPGMNFEGEMPGEMPGMNFEGKMPGMNFEGQTSQMPGQTSGSIQQSQMPQMPGMNFEGQMSQMPGQMTMNSAASAGQIVSGTMTNSAASLSPDYENATYINMNEENSQVNITSSGTYVVSGSSSDGNITVKKATTGVVLVLDNLDLTSTTGATVSVNKQAEVKMIISGNVVLTDNENPEDENSTDAAIADAFDGAALKAKANSSLYVTGNGTLTINGNAKNGIKGGDDSSLIFDGVTVNINAVNDGINGNYDVTLLDGNFTIAAGDDAIHADHILTVGQENGSGPIVRVTKSNEGMEGTVVNVFGGDISVVSSDDAINAANGDGLYEGVLDYSFNMTGGRVTINCAGDGIDSNGNVNLIGGSAQIRSGAVGGEAGIDYDGQLYVSDSFQMNNQSGTAGPDGMGMGQMGGMMPGQMGTTGGQMPGMPESF